MYSYSALEKSRKSEAAKLQRRVPTFRPLQAKEKDNGGLFGDNVHRRVMRGLSSGKQSTSPYLRGSSANAVQLKGIVQRANGDNAYDVGDPSRWHVHHGSHLRFDHHLRVNFAGRTLKKFLKDLRRKIDDNGLANTIDDNFRECIHWIFVHKNNHG